jgi:hypothetical protein
MVLIIGVGTLVVAIGVAILFLAFRTIDNEATSGRRRMGIAAGMLAFIIICCGALYYFAE